MKEKIVHKHPENLKKLPEEWQDGYKMGYEHGFRTGKNAQRIETLSKGIEEYEKLAKEYNDEYGKKKK